MIVAFADRTSMMGGRRRRPSDASQGTRTSTSSDDQMIVSFKRRQSDDSIAKSKSGKHGKSSSRRNKGTSSTTTRKKQTHPSPTLSTIVDPIAAQRRRSADEQENKVRKRNQGKRNSVSCSSDLVIVEFPEHRRSSTYTRTQHHIQDRTLDCSLRSIFKRNDSSRNAQSAKSSSSCCSDGKPISKNYQQSSRLNKSDRQFREHDWRQTSIDWGDSTDEEELSNDEDFCPEKIGKTGRRDPDGFKSYRNGRRGGGIDRSESTTDTWESTRTMTSSLSSLLSGSFRKLDP